MTSIFPVKNKPVFCPFCGHTVEARVSVSQEKPRKFKILFHCKVCNKKIVKKISDHMAKLLNMKSPEEALWADHRVNKVSDIWRRVEEGSPSV